MSRGQDLCLNDCYGQKYLVTTGAEGRRFSIFNTCILFKPFIHQNLVLVMMADPTFLEVMPILKHFFM